MKNTLLLVEDDLSLGATLSERLQKDFQVLWCRNCFEAQQILKSDQDFHLAILDVGLPDGNGFDLAAQIQQKFKNHPKLFIFLTAQADAESRLKGFELGAQEFVPKPFHLKELLLRVHHVLDTHQFQQVIVLEHCQIDLEAMTIKDKTGKIEYPPLTDMKVLQFLIDRAPRSVSRDEIIDFVWGQDKMPSHRSIDNVIVRLRQLLKNEDVIRSVRGVGYSWVNDFVLPPSHERSSR